MARVNKGGNQVKAEGELSRFGLNTNLNVREESKDETRFLADFSPR